MSEIPSPIELTPKQIYALDRLEAWRGIGSWKSTGRFDLETVKELVALGLAVATIEDGCTLYGPTDEGRRAYQGSKTIRQGK